MSDGAGSHWIGPRDDLSGPSPCRLIVLQEIERRPDSIVYPQCKEQASAGHADFSDELLAGCSSVAPALIHVEIRSNDNAMLGRCGG